jgi:hypothetical protein
MMSVWSTGGEKGRDIRPLLENGSIYYHPVGNIVVEQEFKIIRAVI